MPITAGILYPGYSAEDDYPALERIFGDQVRLPLVHTLMREDAHRVDALLDVGSSEVLADGARELLAHGVDAVIWACTSGSFVFGWDGARDQVEKLQAVTGLPTSAPRSRSCTPRRGSGSAGSRSRLPTRRRWPTGSPTSWRTAASR